jgi:hypothetical protein
LSKEGKYYLSRQILRFFIGTVIDEEPSSFDKSWNHNDPKARGKWQDAVKKDLNDFDKHRKTIKYEWIFKVKRSGIFRARLVACEYSQIPVIDFNESLLM